MAEEQSKKKDSSRPDDVNPEKKKTMESDDVKNEASETDNAAQDKDPAQDAKKDGQKAEESGEKKKSASHSSDKKGDKKKEKGSAKADKKKEEAPDPRDEQIAELKDRALRQRAEFENFRKRTEKEKSQMYDMGARAILEKFLPVVDSFERGLANAPEDDAFASGMQAIYKQMTKALEDAGVTAIEAVGQEFDPEYHNAVMHVDDDSYGENEVVEELQRGYLYHDEVVRHSMVKVAN